MTTITHYSYPKHAHLAPTFATIHIACTLEDPRTAANFLAPFDAAQVQRVHAYWEKRLSDAAASGGIDDVIMAFSPPSQSPTANSPIPNEPSPNEPPSGEGKQLIGFLILHQPPSESGPFRANVQQLFVSPNHRRQGIARKLMAEVDRVGRERGRTLLTLGTAATSPAAGMYPKLGFVEYGRLPRHVLIERGGERVDEVCFYKDLEEG